MNFKNFFKKVKKLERKIESDESYCYSKIIWNDKSNLIILLSFTKDYFEQIIELQDAINQPWSHLSSKIVYSSYEEIEKETDEDSIAITSRIIHNKYYMLIGGEPLIWQSLYGKIHNLGNDVLYRITNEIINNCNSEDFKQLIDDGILYFNSTGKSYDSPVVTEDGMYYTDPNVVLKRLPDAFTGRDIIEFIKIFDGGNYMTNALAKILDIKYMPNERFKKSYLRDLYKVLFKNPTIESLTMLLEPLYKQPDDDSIPGDVSDESLDEIFREHYERFSAIIDDSVHYEDIDEVLADEEESENMREGDKLDG